MAKQEEKIPEFVPDWRSKETGEVKEPNKYDPKKLREDQLATYQAKQNAPEDKRPIVASPTTLINRAKAALEAAEQSFGVANQAGDQEAALKAKEKYDAAKTTLSELQTEYGSKPGSRTYKDLSKTWMPLILDQINETPWTIEEILNAMRPIIIRFAREYGRLRAGYQKADAESDGNMAVLDSLRIDAGRAPFGLFAANNIKRAIQKGTKGSSIVPVQYRKRTYTDRNVVSADKETEIGDGKYTITAGIPSTAPGFVEKERCSECKGHGKVKEEETDDNGQPTGKSIEITCPKCGGTGEILRTQKREEMGQPAKEGLAKEQRERLNKIIVPLIELAKLSRQQVECVLLRFGMEGALNPKTKSGDVELIQSTNEEKEPTAISRILQTADTIYRAPMTEFLPNTPESGIWVEAKKLNKTEEFQKIWDDVFGEIPHNKFDPELSTALQIAPLHGTQLPIGEQDIDRMHYLLHQLQSKIANVPVITKSKQRIIILLGKAMERIDRIKRSSPELITAALQYYNDYGGKWKSDIENPKTETPGATPATESIKTIIDDINLLLEYNYQLFLRDVLNGDADIEDMQMII